MVFIGEFFQMNADVPTHATRWAKFDANSQMS